MSLRLVLSELKAIILTEISIFRFYAVADETEERHALVAEDRAAIPFHPKHLAKSLRYC
jgi:hypothetical protein